MDASIGTTGIVLIAVVLSLLIVWSRGEDRRQRNRDHLRAARAQRRGERALSARDK